jgi:E3 ubiquitin-protein ligase TRIP12
MNDTLISSDMTIYGAIHKSESNGQRQHTRSAASLGVWTTAYPVTYKRILATDDDGDDSKKRNSLARRQGETNPPLQLTDNNHICLKILKLLKELASLSQTWQGGDDSVTTATTLLVPQADFVNRKMAAKMQRQLEEPLIVASSCLPDWAFYLMDHYAFLFPFDVRYLFIQSTSFGYSRLIARWQSMQMRNNTQNGQQRHDHRDDSGATGRDGSSSSHHQPTLGTMERKKIQVRRDRILEYAVKIMDLFGSSQPVLEIEYADEEGSGLGPTLEFYALASKEFCKRSTNMWRKGETGELYGATQQGLFPAPMSKRTDAKTRKKTLQLFKSLGQFVAKSMLDFRIIDIPLNTAFFKLLLFANVNPVEIVKVR